MELKKEKICATMPAGVIYNAYINDLSKGNYKVRITHEGDILRSFESEKDTVFIKDFVVE